MSKVVPLIYQLELELMFALAFAEEYTRQLKGARAKEAITGRDAQPNHSTSVEEMVQFNARRSARGHALDEQYSEEERDCMAEGARGRVTFLSRLIHLTQGIADSDDITAALSKTGAFVIDYNLPSADRRDCRVVGWWSNCLKRLKAKPAKAGGGPSGVDALGNYLTHMQNGQGIHIWLDEHGLPDWRPAMAPRLLHDLAGQQQYGLAA